MHNGKPLMEKDLNMLHGSTTSRFRDSTICQEFHEVFHFVLFLEEWMKNMAIEWMGNSREEWMENGIIWWMNIWMDAWYYKFSIS
jgi:hypothetical protein